MSRFMQEGLLDRHIARMRKIYRRRRDALVAALEEAFPQKIEILGRTTGLHLSASFKGLAFDLPRLESVQRAGVILHPVEDFAIVKGQHPGRVAMGYSHLDIPDIKEGIARIERALSSCHP
jgi:GntR family transcriptional regulator/MocR family aminotransferase